jgi:DNA-binding response OmpR family regulator
MEYMENTEKCRVLLIDSHPEDLKQNSTYLQEKGFEVRTASGVKEGAERLKQADVSCVVMDAEFPEEKEFEGFYVIQAQTGAPILFLTERNLDGDRIRGLSMGAGDYMVKPCSVQELALRIMIHVRRQGNAAPSAGVLEFPQLRIDLMTRKVIYDGQEINLSNREFDLLAFLAKHPGKVESFEEIGEELMGNYIDSDRKNVMVSASRLRKKLEAYAGLERMIETVWGRGYCFRG